MCAQATVRSFGEFQHQRELPMYESSFQLDRRPFVATPSIDDYFAAESIEKARNSLIRLIGRDEGPGLVIGPVGIGKTLLCRLLADTFRTACRVAMVSCGRICTRRALLQVILHQLGLSYQGKEEGELRLSLIDHVTSDDFCPNGVLLLIDEANSLPMALLDELRTMTNIVSAGRPRIRLVMFGSSRLEEKFAHPRLESFNQRLAGRYYLEPFNREETFEYILSHFQQCGGNAEGVFAKDALELIYQATNGVPRLINQLCDHALILAALNFQVKVDDELINEAWADLQQLPTPTRSDFLGPSVSNVVEFGELNDETVPLADGAETTLSIIERGLANIRSEQTNQPATIKLHPPKFDDAQLNEPGPRTIHAHAAHNPFADSFEHEEVIVDRIPAASVIAKRHVRQVTSKHSEQIANQLDALLEPTRDSLGSTGSPTTDSHRADSKLDATVDTGTPDERLGARSAPASHSDEHDRPSSEMSAESPSEDTGNEVFISEPRLAETTADTNVAPTISSSLSTSELGQFEQFDGMIRTIELPEMLIQQEPAQIHAARPAGLEEPTAEDQTSLSPEKTAESRLSAGSPKSVPRKRALEPAPLDGVQSIRMKRSNSGDDGPGDDPGNERKPAPRNFHRLFSKLRKAN
jgi:type II secretory pathway predicted ATPase ExeA